VSGKRLNSPDSPLCRFAFADGRRCRSIAHPNFEGLCFQHGTFRSRASRHDNFLRELSPLAKGSTRAVDVSRAERALFRAFTEGRISAEQLAALHRLAALLRHATRFSRDEGFAAGCGPDWEAIRKLMDQRDSEK
jgi:hypothetical protein